MNAPDPAPATGVRRRPGEPDLEHALFRAVRLDAADASEGWRLSTEAQWNQTEVDWRFMLNAGTGFGFEDRQGILCASTVMLRHGEGLAWIGMVLVAASARRQGLATAMIEHARRLARSRAIPAVLLDATAAGRDVYAQLGFRELRGITRWRGMGSADQNPADGGRVREIPGGNALDAAAEWDRERFGADRGPLLRWFQHSRRELALEFMTPAGARAGFCLGHAGRTATHVGPLVADFEEAALALLHAALGRITGAVLIDAADGCPALDRALRERGFTAERSFSRMVCGDGNEPGRNETLYATAGPEYG